MYSERPTSEPKLHQSADIYANLSLDALVEMVSQVEIVYTSLEYVILKDGMKLSDSSRANLRRAQADIQKLRLKLLITLEGKRENEP